MASEQGRLRVSSASWHYRLRGRVFDNEPKDLCSYFWSTVAAVIALTAYYFGITVAAIVRPLGRLGPPIAKYGPYVFAVIGAALLIAIVGLFIYVCWAYPVDVLEVILVLLALMVGAAVAVTLIYFAIQGIVTLAGRRTKKPKPVKVVREAPPKPKTKPAGDPFLKLLFHFLWAKKRRVCPLIEVQHAHEEEAHS